MGEWGWAAARFFPRKVLRRFKPHNDSPPTKEVAKPGLAGCFIYLKKFFQLKMYKDSAVHCAMPSPLTPNLVVVKTNTPEFSLFLVREQKTKCGTQVMKVNTLSRVQSPSENSVPSVGGTSPWNGSPRSSLSSMQGCRHSALLRTVGGEEMEAGAKVTCSTQYQGDGFEEASVKRTCRRVLHVQH